MGKTGGHKKRTSKTGSQKKILKQYEKEFKATAGTRARSQEFLDKFITGEGQVEGIKNAQALLAPILQAQRQEQLSEFDKSTLPQLQAQYGGGGRSSAFNQALLATRANLEQQLFNRSQEYALNYGSQLAQNQQAAAQQGTQAGLFQGNTAVQTDRFAFAPRSTPVLTQLVTGAAGGASQGFAANAGSAGPSAGAAGSAGSAGSAGAAGAGASSAPAAAAAASSREIKENIVNYDKGLEALPFIEVKNYDYKMEVPGRKENRVGVIAEDLPEELRVDIEGLLHADVYGLVGLLINCVKQLDQKVKMLEAA